MQRLQARGHEAYLVGGCVRDLLLGHQPKDFDIATGARPTQVKRTFPRNCRIIGRRFKLAHLHFNKNQKILEVATFRTSPTADGEDDDLLITRDNEFGTAEEDALRRDFTVNALFFDPIADRIIDYVDGIDDVHNRLLRTIGDPIVRFREDPVRIIRAAKFAGRLDLGFETATYEAMAEVAPDLSRSAPPRMLLEILNLLRGGHSLESFQILRDIGALRVILPVVAEFLGEARENDRVHFWRTLEALDLKVLAGEDIPNPVLLGALFAGPIRARAEREHRRSSSTVAETLIGPFAKELRLPRRDAGCLKRICGVQQRFTVRGPKRFKIGSFLRDPYFSEALLLFELTSMARGDGMADLVRWQQMYNKSQAEDRDDDEPAAEAEVARNGDPAESAPAAAADDEAESSDAPRRRRRRRRRRGSGGGEGGDAPRSAETDEPDQDDAEAAADTESAEPQPARKAKRSRRRSSKRDRDESGEREAEAQGSGRQKGQSKKTDKKKAGQKKAGQKKTEEKQQKRGKKAQKKRGKRSKGRDNRVETIEPEAIDVSAFDLELDPRHVPTFGVIVEGAESKKKKKKRVPQAPSAEDEDYKPPPPPSHEPEPPPPPPADDEFGDW